MATVLKSMEYDRLDWRYKLKIALSYFLPSMAVAVCIFSLFYYHEFKKEKQLYEVHACNIVDMQKIKLSEEFEFIAADLLFLANYSQMLFVLEDLSSQRMGQLINDLSLFASESRIYDQIRVLDSTGMEVIRINWDQDGPVVVKEDQLQFKGKRYYFKDSYELTKNEVYVSPFDLNIEHSEIEQPLKPMLRFGTPIFDKEGEKSGILLFNYLGANLIRMFKDVILDSAGEYMLVNNRGFWIIGSDAEKEWGFMYEDKQELTLGNAYPEAWKVISESESGQFYTQEGLFTFETVFPLLVNGKSFMPVSRMKDAEEQYWKVISYIPQKQLTGVTSKLLSRHIYIFILLTMIIGVGSWAIAFAKARRKQSDELLKKVNDELERKVKDRTEELKQSNNNLLAEASERKRIEQDREELLKILKSKNEELQSVVYIASHDLRSPLVNINGFSAVLNESCTEIVDILKGLGISDDSMQRIISLIEEDIPESLKFISAGTEKMEMLLDGLLRVSRVGTEEINILALDINLIIKNVCESMEFQIKEADVEVTTDDLPGCRGDANMMNQLFSNLAGNALKYLDADRKGKIHISGRVENSQCIYCVEDNGIGIAREHQPKVFELFHRLNPDDSVGGEGLGLTIVTRILDRLNGHIRVESEAGKGSRFFVSLPAG